MCEMLLLFADGIQVSLFSNVIIPILIDLNNFVSLSGTGNIKS